MGKQTIGRAHPKYQDYFITVSGEVYSYKSGRKRYGHKLKVQTSPDGYLRYKINNQYISLHKLLVECFIGSIPKGYQVNHIDGNKLNNSLGNLEVITQKQNLYHAMKTGLHVNPHKKVTAINKLRQHITFNSYTEAQYFTGAFVGNIGKCISGERKTAGGYKWGRYEEA